jgi:RHS repeat-associated protein
VTFLENNSESAAAIYRYDPFGNLISKSGSLADANVYRFSSKEIHVNSGMYYYGYRFYDPTLQRWINRDPIAERGGLNLYTFVENMPFSGVDKWGLDLQVDAKDKCDYEKAKKYLSKDPKMEVQIKAVEKAKKKFKLKTNSSDDDSFNPRNNTINWDPKSALRTTSGGKQSPALGLGHEICHAGKNNPNLTPVPGYDNAEERRVIVGPETSAAITLGEDTRTNHGGSTYRVSGPTKR